MRVAIFVAVVVAHLIAILFLLWSSPWLAHANADEEPITSISLAPLVPEPVSPSAGARSWQAPMLYGSESGGSSSERSPVLLSEAGSPPSRPEKARGGLDQKTGMAAEEQAVMEQGGTDPSVADSNRVAPDPIAPDWRAQAEMTAELSAGQIVAAEDATERRANALTSRFRALPPPRVPGPQFGWDYAPTHRFMVLPGGGLVYTVNDHCQIMVLVFPFFGCTIGKLPVNGELFKNMHPPVKYGDWDWRLRDP